MSVVVFVLVSVCHIVFRLLIVDFVEYSMKSFKKMNNDNGRPHAYNHEDNIPKACPPSVAPYFTLTIATHGTNKYYEAKIA